MADKNIVALAALTAPISTDIIYIVDDPGTTPLDRKIALSDLGKGLVASNIPNVAAGTVVATDVQAAIDELDTEKAAVAQTMYIGSTAVAINRATAALALTGITSIDGSSASCVGQAATVATITGLAPDTATTQATQGAITSLGTLSALAMSGALTGATTGAFTAASSLTLGTASSAAGGIIMQNATNANTVTMQSGVTATTYAMTLPTAVAGAGEVLTDAAGNGTLSWASAESPTCLKATDWSVAARLTQAVINTGAVTIGTGGAQLTTGATAASSVTVNQLNTAANGSAEDGSPLWSTQITFTTLGTDFEIVACLGFIAVSGTAIDYTDRHAGFKLKRVASGDVNLYATQGDNSTETASGILTTCSVNDSLELIFKINGASSIDYYWRKNDGSLSAATNLMTNFPNTALKYAWMIGNTNMNTASATVIEVAYSSYER